MQNQVLCIESEGSEILALGTGGEDGVAHRRWLPAEVRRAIVEGERFFMICPTTGLEVDIEVRDGRVATVSDGYGESSLRQLRACRWR